MKQRIAFICLVPDTGHVLPLLRLAVSFSEQQYEVRCFFPEETEAYVKEFNIPVQFFGNITWLTNPKVFGMLSQRSVFYNAFSFYKDIYLNYIYPITVAVNTQIELIKELLEQYHPGLIIVDNHWFQHYYMYLAGHLNLEIVFHESGGNYRYINYFNHQSSHKFKIAGKDYRFSSAWFTSIYGLTHHSPYIQSATIFFGKKLNRLSRWLLEKKLGNKLRNIMADSDSQLKQIFPRVDIQRITPTYISTGLPFIEQELLNSYFPWDRLLKGLNLFPPIKDQRKSEMNPALRHWIDAAGEKPIVYVSLGTVVQSNPKLLKKIIRGFMGLDIYILWSAPLHLSEMIRKIGKLPNLRVEEYVPQPQILALENVRCFISHGGAGGIQDSLLNGKPLLCIPFMFDQPFNSSVVELLQIGIKIWKNKLTPKSVRRSLLKLLYDPLYRDNAREIMMRFQPIANGPEVIRFLQERKLIKTFNH